jgi:galactose mutarotase-like enzyme
MIVTIGDGEDSLAVDTAAGGRICSLILAGRERILRVPAAGIDPGIGWGCYLMAPFVGRVKDGIVKWSGRTVQLRLNDGRNSIHGAALDADWTVLDSTASSVKMSCRFDESRWPFKGSMTQSLGIARGRLTLRAEVHADEPMPAAIGWHPWFRSAGEPLKVGLKSDAVLRLAGDLIPTGDLDPVDARTDLRSEPDVTARSLDDVYTAVRSPVSVCWPDLELTMAFDDPIGAFVVCTRPEAAAVEPLTAWPDSIRLAAAGHSETGLVSLEAGGSLVATTNWSWRRIGPRTAAASVPAG